MDISQIPIKINQNNSSANGKQLAASQNGGSPGFLSQILAFVSQLNSGNADDSKSSGKNSSNGRSAGADPNQASGGDIMQLSSILAMLGAVAVNNVTPVEEPSMLAKLSPVAESDIVELRADITGLVQKLTAAGIETSQGGNAQDLSLKQMISSLQSGLDDSKGLPDELLGKFKQALDQLDAPDTVQPMGPETSAPQNSGTQPVPLPGIILDKNQLAIAGRTALPEGVQANLSKNQNQNVEAGRVILHPTAQANQNQQGIAGSTIQLNGALGIQNQLGITGRAVPLNGIQAIPPITNSQIAAAGRVEMPGRTQVNVPKMKKQTGVDASLFAAEQPLQTAQGNTAPKAGLLPVIPVSDFNREISDWMGKSLTISKDQTGSTEAKFSLYPEHLGPVEIKVISQNGEITAQIATGTSLAKEALQGQLPQLHQALLEHGLQVQKLDIVQQAPSGTNQSNLPFSQSGYQPPQEQKQFQQARGSTGNSDDGQSNFEADVQLSTYGGGNISKTSSIDFTA